MRKIDGGEAPIWLVENNAQSSTRQNTDKIDGVENKDVVNMRNVKRSQRDSDPCYRLERAAS